MVFKNIRLSSRSDTSKVSLCELKDLRGIVVYFA